MAGGPGGADGAEHAEGGILGRDAERQRAREADLHGPRAELPQALCCEHVFHLGCSDAKRKGAEGPVRAGMRVAADDHRSRERQAELRADHVHDALPSMTHAKAGDSVLRAVALQRRHLCATDLVSVAPRVGRRRHVVVHGRHDLRRPADPPARDAKTLERLG